VIPAGQPPEARPNERLLEKGYVQQGLGRGVVGYVPPMRLPAGYQSRSPLVLGVLAVAALAGLTLVLLTANGSEVLFGLPFAIVAVLCLIAISQSARRRRDATGR
jgi:hypothetical protein